jgi:hypothetical protein
MSTGIGLTLARKVPSPFCGTTKEIPVPRAVLFGRPCRGRLVSHRASFIGG